MIANGYTNKWIISKLYSPMHLLLYGFYRNTEFLRRDLMNSEGSGMPFLRCSLALGQSRTQFSPGTPRWSLHSVLPSPGFLIYNVHLSYLKITFSWLQSRIPTPMISLNESLNSLPSILAISSRFLSLPDLIYLHLRIFPSLYGLTCWLGQDLGRPQVMLSHFSSYSYLAELLLMRCLGSQPTIRFMARSWGAQLLCWSRDDWDSGKGGGKQKRCY